MTRVDGLPLDGMQEVRSSNLLSSTGQKAKFEKAGQRAQQQSTATATASDAAGLSGPGAFLAYGCRQGPRCQGPELTQPSHSAGRTPCSLALWPLPHALAGRAEAAVSPPTLAAFEAISPRPGRAAGLAVPMPAWCA